MKHVLLGVGLVLMLLGQGATAAVNTRPTAGCGGFPRADNGPHDYSVVRDRRLHVVEEHHFTPNIESLISGNTSAFVSVEISFVLRAFPNHHRALMSIIRLGEKQKTDNPKGSQYTIPCWLERAVHFAPHDRITRMIYAGWLGKKGKVDDAVKQLEAAERLADGNAFSLYNIGLVYLDLGLFEPALAKAHQAQALGFSRSGLADSLKAAGKWREPPPPAEPASAPAESASEPASAPALAPG